MQIPWLLFEIPVFAGKDRTGLAAAIILTLLGVSKEDIVKDYLKTNELRAAANEEQFEQMRSSGASDEAIDAVKIAMFVQDSLCD